MSHLLCRNVKNRLIVASKTACKYSASEQKVSSFPLTAGFALICWCRKRILLGFENTQLPLAECVCVMEC